MAKIISQGLSFDDVLIIPKYNKIASRESVSFKTKVTRRYEIEMPILAANMDTVCEATMAIALGKLGGLGVIHRFMEASVQADQVKLVKQAGLLAAAAAGIKDVSQRVAVLAEAGVDIIVLDIAHGHSEMMLNALKYIKTHFPNIDVIVGNLVTTEAAKLFIDNGADALKVGIGPGSMCITRLMTGVGMPQLTAIMDIYEVAKKANIPVCADGGIKHSGDVTKAIGAGASTVMLGSLLAGTTEAPGEVIVKNGEQYKEFRGMASLAATMRKKKLDGIKFEKNYVAHVEGESAFIPLKGEVEPIIKGLLNGLSSGMTYVGVDSVEKLRGNVDFVQITAAGMKESKLTRM